MSATEAPLNPFRILGIRENWIGINPGTPAASQVPGGSCWHCGTGIAIEVVIQNLGTGETHTIGTTCAERVGLDAKELKQFLAEKYADERERKSAAYRRQRREEWEKRDAAETAEHGNHGTASRFLSGCPCIPCLEAAPHGTTQRFFNRNCHCLECIDAVLTNMPKDYQIDERDCVVDLDTGEVVEARKVSGQYGPSWCIGDADAWLPVFPKRRSTQAKRGYVEAEAPFLVEVCGSRNKTWYKEICRLGDPIVDSYGERIVRPGVPA